MKHLMREKMLFTILMTFLIIFIGTVSITPLFVGDIFEELVKQTGAVNDFLTSSGFSIIRLNAPAFKGLIATGILIAIAGIIRAGADFTQGQQIVL